jgi:hypothetical protein
LGARRAACSAAAGDPAASRTRWEFGSSGLRASTSSRTRRRSSWWCHSGPVGSGPRKSCGAHSSPYRTRLGQEASGYACASRTLGIENPGAGNATCQWRSLGLRTGSPSAFPIDRRTSPMCRRSSSSRARSAAGFRRANVLDQSKPRGPKVSTKAESFESAASQRVVPTAAAAATDSPTVPAPIDNLGMLMQAVT